MTAALTASARRPRGGGGQQVAGERSGTRVDRSPVNAPVPGSTGRWRTFRCVGERVGPAPRTARKPVFPAPPEEAFRMARMPWTTARRTSAAVAALTPFLLTVFAAAPAQA